MNPTRIYSLDPPYIERLEEARALLPRGARLYVAIQHVTRSGYWQLVRAFAIRTSAKMFQEDLVEVTTPLGLQYAALIEDNGRFVIRIRGGEPAIVKLVQDVAFRMHGDPDQLVPVLL